MKYHHYNKKLKSNAGILRKNSTLSEIILWTNLLKSRGLKGYQFYRQRPISKYVADFFCKDLKLIIELDGESHIGNNKKDRARQSKLEGLGYTIIRFDDSVIYEEFGIVKRVLEKWIEEYEGKHPEVKQFSRRNYYSSK